MELLSKKLFARILPVPWQQPTITSNGSLGGDRFAVQPSFVNGGYNCGGDGWQAFDNNGGTAWGTYWERHGADRWITFYNPVPLRVQALNLTFRGVASDRDYYHTGTTVYACNDNASWQTIYSYGATSGSVQNFAVNSSNFYKYHRLYIWLPGSDDHDGFGLIQCNITAEYEDFV